MGHLGESHLAPFKNSLVFSRRQRLQSAPVYRAICAPSDPPPLWRAAAIVRNRRNVLDGTNLEASRLQRPDRRLTARAWTLHEDIDLAHAMLHRAASGRLRGHLRCEWRGLPRALKSDLTGRGPGNNAPRWIGDGLDGVVERALDVSMSVRDVLSFLAADFLDAGSALWRHPRSSTPEVIGPMNAPAWARRGPAWRLAGLLLADLLLAGDCLGLALAGTCVGLGALAVYRQAAAVPDALVAADLDLPPDVTLDLAAQVTLDLVVRLDPVPQPDEFVVVDRVNAGVAADTGRAQRLESTSLANAVNVGKRDLKPLLARQVDAH